MNKVKIAPVDEIKPGQARQIGLLGRTYAIFNINGKLYGLDGSCKHMKASLCRGHIDGTIVSCPMHDWKYDITTGACLTEEWARLQTYPVEIENDFVYLVLP